MLLDLGGVLAGGDKSGTLLDMEACPAGFLRSITQKGNGVIFVTPVAGPQKSGVLWPRINQALSCVRVH